MFISLVILRHYFDSGIRHIRKFYDKEAQGMIEKNIKRLLETDDLRLDDLLTMGLIKLRALSNRKSDLTRINMDMIAKLAEIFQEWEEIQDTWEALAIGGSICDHPFFFNNEQKIRF